jgi:hypothetical protein
MQDTRAKTGVDARFCPSEAPKNIAFCRTMTVVIWRFGGFGLPTEIGRYLETNWRPFLEGEQCKKAKALTIWLRAQRVVF